MISLILFSSPSFSGQVCRYGTVQTEVCVCNAGSQGAGFHPLVELTPWDSTQYPVFFVPWTSTLLSDVSKAASGWDLSGVTDRVAVASHVSSSTFTPRIDRPDGLNGIFLVRNASLWNAYVGPSNLIAEAFYWAKPDCQNDSFRVENDIYVKHWLLDPGESSDDYNQALMGSSTGPYPAYPVMFHEMGHTIGFDHSTVESFPQTMQERPFMLATDITNGPAPARNGLVVTPSEMGKLRELYSDGTSPGKDVAVIPWFLDNAGTATDPKDDFASEVWTSGPFSFSSLFGTEWDLYAPNVPGAGSSSNFTWGGPAGRSGPPPVWIQIDGTLTDVEIEYLLIGPVSTLPPFGISCDAARQGLLSGGDWWIHKLNTSLTEVSGQDEMIEVGRYPHVFGLDHRLAQMVMNEPPCQLCRASSIGASLAGRAEAFGSTVW